MTPYPKNPHLFIVVPTFNEADNLPLLAEALFALPFESLDLLVVDDNSPDGTGQIAEELKNKYSGRVAVIHRQRKMGLGTAYIEGFSAAIEAGAQAVCQMDADFSHPPEKVTELMDALQSCDVALGSRYVPGGAVDREWPSWRKALSEFGNIYARIILRLPVRDATGGFRIWRSDTLAGMPLARIRSNGYAFQVEMAYLFYRLGYSYKEIPFYFSDRKWGQSKMSFRIQQEAAMRVWGMLYDYRNLKKAD
jgi:dolichol-phosphate mannosyltransferase